MCSLESINGPCVRLANSICLWVHDKQGYNDPVMSFQPFTFHFTRKKKKNPGTSIQIEEVSVQKVQDQYGTRKWYSARWWPIEDALPSQLLMSLIPKGNARKRMPQPEEQGRWGVYAPIPINTPKCSNVLIASISRLPYKGRAISAGLERSFRSIGSRRGVQIWLSTNSGCYATFTSVLVYSSAPLLTL